MPDENSPCLFLLNEEMPDDDDEHVALVESEGFWANPLDTASIEESVRRAFQIDANPSTELIVESFAYLWRFDNHLPHPGALGPPPIDLDRHVMERKFYDGLGPESLDQRCAARECGKGKVRYSLYCREHHFEQLFGKDCPFDH
jgi:hypothetical protein